MRMRSKNPARVLLGAVADGLARELISGRAQVLGLISGYKRLYFTKLAGIRCIEEGDEKKSCRLDFDIYLKEANGEEKVLKVPRCRTDRSCERYLALSRDKELFEKYRSAMLGIDVPSRIARHVNRALEVRRDGGYVCPYVRGYELRRLKRDLLRGALRIDAALRHKIARQAEGLVDDIEQTRREGGLVSGEWRLENLVYDVQRDIIVNVSTQSFFWSDKEREKAGDALQDPDTDHALEELRTLIRLLDKKEQKRVQEKIACVTKLLDYAKDTEVSYSGRIFESGYHSVELGEVALYGQRHPVERLKHVPYDFDGKVVLDLGCNIGGMLHHLAPRLRRGVGLDGSLRAINAANAVASVNKAQNVRFYVFDLDGEDYRLWESFTLGEAVDICFLLSMCMWIRKWKQVVDAAARTAPHLLLETNGTDAQQQAQLDYVRMRYAKVHLCARSSLDDSIQKNRSLYLCRRF